VKNLKGNTNDESAIIYEVHEKRQSDEKSTRQSTDLKVDELE